MKKGSRREIGAQARCAAGGRKESQEAAGQDADERARVAQSCRRGESKRKARHRQAEAQSFQLGRACQSAKRDKEPNERCGKKNHQGENFGRIQENRQPLESRNIIVAESAGETSESEVAIEDWRKGRNASNLCADRAHDASFVEGDAVGIS